MRQSKYIFSLLMSFALIGLMSCGESEGDCPVVPLDEYVLGDWNISGSMVSFNSDGSYIDEDNILDKSNIQKDLISTKDYAIADSNLVVSITSTGSISLETSYNILDVSCNTFNIEWVSGTSKLTLSR